jgi:single-strand DNA-binding protein
MTDVNVTVIQGRLTRDPELKYTAKGTAVLSFSIASNKSIKKNDQWEDETSFFDIVQFGKVAEYTKQKISRGVGVLVSGELKQERWEKDGQQRSRVTVVAQSVLPVLREQAAPQAAPQATTQVNFQATTQVAKPADDFDDDIPF